MLSIYNLEDIQTKTKLTHFHCNFNFLDNEEIEKIFEIVNRTDYSSAILGDEKHIDTTIRSSKLKWIHLTSETQWLYNKISLLVNHTNKELWNFNVRYCDNCTTSLPTSSNYNVI